MPLNAQVSIIGIIEIGTWAATNGGTATNVFNAANIYTRTSLGRPAAEGATVTPNISTVKQKAGDTGGTLDSAISEYGAQLQIKLASATLNNIRQMMALPSAALTGDLSAATPTAETLVVKGVDLATMEMQFYVKSVGPKGPRTNYFPRCQLETVMAMPLNKNAHVEPGGTFELLENASGELFWTVDATS